MTIRVGVIGYGTIGKRVVSAVQAQTDMELVGIGLRTPKAAALATICSETALFCTDQEYLPDLSRRGIAVQGMLVDLLSQVDVVVDCTPSGKAIERLPIYDRANVLAIFQGGEKHRHVGFTFNTFVNYRQARKQRQARVGSCNTTGLVRLLSVLYTHWGITSTHIALVRCATDPDKGQKGIVNGAVPTPGISHHADDLRWFFPETAFYTQAIAVPMTYGHVVMLAATLQRDVTEHEVLDVLQHTPRILLDSACRGWSTANLHAHFAEEQRLRGDRPELFIWEDSVHIEHKTLCLVLNIHMESIVIPETIDCIRAMTKQPLDLADCMWKTDTALGIARSTECYQSFAD